MGMPIDGNTIMQRLILVLIGLLVFAGGCTSQPYVTPARQNRGLVVVLTGIEGRSLFNEAICRALNEGGVRHAIELEDWTIHVPLGYLYNLRAEGHNRSKAARIAERIALYQEEYPGRPVVLVGQSGGGAMAVWICEAMPEDKKVDGVILLAAALSPEYPLTDAIRNSKRGIVNFHSFGDTVLLWLGTTVYGTMDGQHTSSAGRVGFRIPEGSKRTEEYDRLFQVPWTKDMAITGNIGGHLTSGAPGFVASYLPPFILAEEWNGDLVKKVIERSDEPVATREEDAASQPATPQD